MKPQSKAVKVLGALVMIILFIIGLLTGFIVEKNHILLGLIFIAIAVFYGLSKLKPKSKAVKVLGGLVMIVLWIFYGYYDYQYHCADWIFWWDRIFCNYSYE